MKILFLKFKLRLVKSNYILMYHVLNNRTLLQISCSYHTMFQCLWMEVWKKIIYLTMHSKHFYLWI